MYALKFAKTYDFAIMIKNNLEHVLEDYFCIDGNTFCVADGVTRDRTDGKPVVYPQTLEEAQDLIAHYPNPSGATKAAKICADTFVKEISKKENVDEVSILDAVKTANSEIAKLNSNRKIDFGIDDYYCCVAAGGRIVKNVLYGFSICDCRIKILDSNYDIIFDTTKIPDNMSLTISKDLFFVSKLYKGKWNWNNIKYRMHFRKKYRNSSWYRITRRYTYGALTGQKSAIPFVHTYTVPLENAKYIIAHSDGCDECLVTKEQIRDVINNPEQIQNELHEKTLIIYEKV